MKDGKRQRSVIRKSSGISDVLPSPRAHSKPRCAGQFDPGTVGLGIVVMLGKSSAMHNALLRPLDLNPIRGKCDRTYGQPRDEDRSVTLVYYDGNEENIVFDRVGWSRDDVSGRPSPTRRTEEDVKSVGVVNVFPSLEFLSSCDLCGKNLHGRDVYIYRGEKAFCSTDCRSKHMMNDERKDLTCRSETPKAMDFSPCSPYNKDQIFSAGILAI